MMFGLDPEEVFSSAPFVTVVSMLSSKLRHNEYDERYNAAKEFMQPINNTQTAN